MPRQNYHVGCHLIGSEYRTSSSSKECTSVLDNGKVDATTADRNDLFFFDFQKICVSSIECHPLDLLHFQLVSSIIVWLDVEAV